MKKQYDNLDMFLPFRHFWCLIYYFLFSTIVLYPDWILKNIDIHSVYTKSQINKEGQLCVYVDINDDKLEVIFKELGKWRTCLIYFSVTNNYERRKVNAKQRL